MSHNAIGLLKANGQIDEYANTSGGGDSKNFIGTNAEWNALTTSQQNQYDTVDITDDGNMSSGYYEVTGDGTKTLSELLDELSTLFDINSINVNTAKLHFNNNIYTLTRKNGSIILEFTSTFVASGSDNEVYWYLICMDFRSSASKGVSSYMAPSGVYTFRNHSSDVVGNGAKITLTW